MSLAEEMLATMPLSDDSATYSADEEPHIVINESRQAIVPNELKMIAVTGDKDIETVTFDCVRYWDGNDLSTFAIYLNYVLPNLSVGTYIPESIVADGDVFHFDWNIKNNITKKNGKISFAITAIKTKKNESGETVVDKQWSSIPNSDCSIVCGLDIYNVPSEEESSNVLAQMSAILQEIHAGVDEWIKTALVQEIGYSEEKAMSQKATTVAIEDAKSYARSYTDDKSVKLNADIQKNYQIAIRNSKQIENLKIGISEQFELDSSVSYVKDVPANSLPYAEIAKVGGMTYRDDTTNTLSSAKVTEVKSVGVNMAPPLEIGKGISNGIVITDHSRATTEMIPIDAKETYVWSNIVSDITSSVFFYNEKKEFMGRTIATTRSSLVITSAIMTSELTGVGGNISYIRLSQAKNPNNAGAIETLNTQLPMLNKGANGLPYTPYVEHTLSIPEAVRPAHGINDMVHDFIEWGEHGTIKLNILCESIDLSSLSYAIYINSKGQTLWTANLKSVSNIGLCDKYRFVPIVDTERMEELTIQNRGNIIYICDSSLSSAAEIVGTFLYARVEPVITDISNLITSDNLIGVEGGGTLTFENEYGYAVPSEVEYQVEV